jgi:dTDP-glucose 4,6-dehydratase
MDSALVTGGAGFIGHHLIEHLFKNTDWNIVCLDRLDTSGNLNRLTEILDGTPDYKKRFQFVWHDLKAAINSQIAHSIGKVRHIFHLAAGSHVDRSIADPLSFVYDNVVGSAHLFDYARHVDSLQSIINFSTDEVFGPAPHGTFYAEWDRYDSTNPYSATKAGAEELGIAFANTYGLPVITTHSMNVFGERQHPEKFVPMCIKRVLHGEKVLIHCNKANQPGSRHYIHARNVSDAVLFLAQHGQKREKYNIVGHQEVNNHEMAQFIAEIIGKPLDCELIDFHSSRPGHDLRYALKDTKLAAMGFEYKVSFDESLRRTVWWTFTNKRWLE